MIEYDRVTKPKYIYTITVIEAVEHLNRPRIMAWYPSLKKAKNTLKENIGSLHECLYMYAVIEKVREGVMPLNDDRWWYGWIENAWVAIEEPLSVSNTVNFGIG